MLAGQRRHRHIPGVLLAALAIVACQSDGSPRVPLDVHVGGRTVVGAENPLQHTYTWPGVYFEARFTGPVVTIEIDDDQNDLLLLVDGEHHLVFPRVGRRSVTLRDLGAGEHTVRLEKMSETQGPTGDFLGFFVPGEDNVLPPPHYARLIEFIGDSNTVGYGNASTGRDCTGEQVRTTTNTSLAFAPRVARHFGADYRIIASSGIGLVRNYANSNPGKTIPVLYERTLHDDPDSTVPDERSPNVIVIRIGTNDFSTALGNDERWDSEEALRKDFRDSYVRFVEHLDARHAPQRFVLVAEENFAADVDAVRDTLGARGNDRVVVTQFSGLARTGCHYHLSVSDHALAASQLVTVLSAAGLSRD